MEERITQLIIKYKDIFLIKEYESLAKYTTVRLGGKARAIIFVEQMFDSMWYTTLSEQPNYAALRHIYEASHTLIQDLIQEMTQAHIPYFILGAGSDTLFSDELYEGIIIRITAHTCIPLPHTQVQQETDTRIKHSTQHQRAGTGKLDFEEIHFEEQKDNPSYCYVEAGMGIIPLINLTLKEHLSGIHWFAHIPASIGGAIFNNIHGGEYLFSEYVEAVVLLDKEAHIVCVPYTEMLFAYDFSRIHTTNELVIGVLLRLYKQTDAEIEKAQKFVDQWVTQKYAVQPKFYSVGSTFKNLTQEQKKKYNLPTTAAGYLIDKAGLKGYSIGDAQIYTDHANFFLNKGNASAHDYKALIEYAQKVVYEKFGILLEPEVRMINFDTTS